jgi:hypothetical protein
MRWTALLASIVLASVSLSAQAGVIYRWQGLTENPDMGFGAGVIEIDDAYWHPNGTLMLVSADTQVGLPAYAPIPGLLDFFFSATVNPCVDCTPVSYNPRPCYLFAGCPAGKEDVLLITGSWNFDLVLGSVLSGSLSANNTTTDVKMGSQGPLWTIGDYASDGGPHACQFSRCTGGTGLWVLDLSTVPSASPVPEPETLAMFLLGFCLVSFVATRKAGPQLGA